LDWAWKAFEADFNTRVDIGCDSDKRFWKSGLASEGAKPLSRNLPANQEIDEVLSMASIGK